MRGHALASKGGQAQPGAPRAQARPGPGHLPPAQPRGRGSAAGGASSGGCPAQ